MRHIDHARLEASLSELAGAATAHDLAGTLQLVIERAAGIFSVAGVGLMLAGPKGALGYVAASDRSARLLEEAQEAVGEGPCVDSYVHGQPVRTEDVVLDGRWPRLGARLRASGIRGVLGIPTRVGGTVVGSLNAYAGAAHAWDESDSGALGAYNGLVEQHLAASVALRGHERLVGQLQHALDMRVDVERAVGIVMARDGVGAAEAFQRLRALARSRRQKVVEVARGVVAGTPAADDPG